MLAKGGKVNGLQLTIGLLGVLFLWGGGAQEIFAKVRTLLLRKKVMSLIHIMIIPTKTFFSYWNTSKRKLGFRLEWDKVVEQNRKESGDYQNSCYARNFQATLQLYQSNLRSKWWMCSHFSIIYKAYIRRNSKGQGFILRCDMEFDRLHVFPVESM